MSVFDPNVFDPTVFEAEADPNMAASGTLTLVGSAALQLQVSFDAVATLSLTGTAALLTDITMATAGVLELTGVGALKVARFARRLVECGEPLTTYCQDWILGNRDPRRDD